MDTNRRDLLKMVPFAGMAAFFGLKKQVKASESSESFAPKHSCYTIFAGWRQDYKTIVVKKIKDIFPALRKRLPKGKLLSPIVLYANKEYDLRNRKDRKIIENFGCFTLTAVPKSEELTKVKHTGEYIGLEVTDDDRVKMKKRAITDRPISILVEKADYC